mmetsp:Transcript_16313/g.23902  ORF Transcript_16313/g.23902 Transcript_16313/m.23902 type:complete len:236 (-) Transcript_16313:7-714(-)
MFTHRLSRISASMWSSSTSINSIFSRMHCMAASVHRAARSAPTKPCVRADKTLGSTDSLSIFMSRVWMRMISRRPASSGQPMWISRSKRPKRRRAGSMVFCLLVAPMTITLERPLRPSMSTSSCDTIRFSTSPLAFSRFGAMESISSMKMIAGELASASSKALRSWLSDSPAIFDMISGPLMVKKKAPVSLATARAIKVLPEPGGPNSSTPRGGLTPSVLNSVGCLSGSSIISRI